MTRTLSPAPRRTSDSVLGIYVACGGGRVLLSCWRPAPTGPSVLPDSRDRRPPGHIPTFTSLVPPWDPCSLGIPFHVHPLPYKRPIRSKKRDSRHPTEPGPERMRRVRAPYARLQFYSGRAGGLIRSHCISQWLRGNREIKWRSRMKPLISDCLLIGGEKAPPSSFFLPPSQLKLESWLINPGQ